MSQYERMVSYLYQYKGEEKQANVGYVRVEKRGGMCRFSIQMRAVPLQNVPTVYCYRQLSEGIATIPAGVMSVRNGSLWYKGVSSEEALFHTGAVFEEIDGIFIDADKETYFATSWKNDTFRRGNWSKNSTNVECWKEELQQSDKEERKELLETAVCKEKQEKSPNEQVLSEKEAESGRQENMLHGKETEENIGSVKEMKTEQAENMADGKELKMEQPQKTVRSDEGQIENVCAAEQTGNDSEAVPAQDVQMQSVCGVCPFKRKMYDYGKRILMSFPSMQPFSSDVAKACVRMELQDIGCLPIASWSLSGNRFLLHGYYCYRHLIFVQMANGSYQLGVPGVYSERDRRNGMRYGFHAFQSIGDFGRQQGAFGYWLLELPQADEGRGQ